ncbi:hypothetical protein XENOCAPTIV_029569, partial [Xenoophorus captivus]
EDFEAMEQDLPIVGEEPREPQLWTERRCMSVQILLMMMETDAAGGPFSEPTTPQS